MSMKMKYILSFTIVFIVSLDIMSQTKTIHVSSKGNDTWNGSLKNPVATIYRAQELARSLGKETSVDVIFDDGIYYLSNTVKFTSQDNKNYPAVTTYKARNSGRVIISGGKRINLKWKKYRDDIYVADVLGDYDIDQLYIDDKKQQMARFPNSVHDEGKNVYDTWTLNRKVKSDSLMDPLSKTRINSWHNPVGGYVHAMHSALWGDMHWYIKGRKSDGTLNMEGGWQNNRPSSMHKLYRMVENIKEELDVPGEWYYDKDKRQIYYMPFEGMDINKAKVEVVCLKHLLEFNGSIASPVEGIKIVGMKFKHTKRTFMENKEPLLRSDWTIYRGGAIVFNGAENCIIEDCEFDNVGGNTIFINNYNRYICIKGCYIHDSGANGIAFVGDPGMVRSPLFRYGPQKYDTIDKTPGSKGINYPQDCFVDDCLITRTGRFEKQTAPIQISMSQRIKVSHCSIYDVPRAGININEGTFGGHIIEFCDVFDTVLETGDHGSFNSWGRDRFWTNDVNEISRQAEKHPGIYCWDIVEPNVLRYNRWRCDHGWDIDLDDGSSFYRIYCNVLLNGGLKMREGFDRIATNNIIINSSLHPHVWVRNSLDVFKHNIVFKPYMPAAMGRALGKNERWGKELDYNLFFTTEDAMRKFSGNMTDMHSIVGNPLFVNPQSGDYRVKPSSPAFEIGFRNFSMTDFGVKSKKLKRLAKTPKIPKLVFGYSVEKTEIYSCLGASLRLIKGNELSAYGASLGNSSIVFESVPDNSQAFNLGLRTGDLLIDINGESIHSFKELESFFDKYTGSDCKIGILRNQEKSILCVSLPEHQ